MTLGRWNVVLLVIAGIALVGGCVGGAGTLAGAPLFALALFVLACSGSHRDENEDPDGGEKDGGEQKCSSACLNAKDYMAAREACAPGCKPTDPTTLCASFDVCGEDGRTVEQEWLCCPAGACNYGIRICDDGTCTNQFYGKCPEPAGKGGSGGTGGASGTSSGSCAGSSDPQCVSSCSGYVARDCQNGMTVEACCPAGVACNFGLGVKFCDDGTCGPGECGDGDADAGS